MDCPICLEILDKKIVTCGCESKLHVTCAQEYLLHSNKVAQCISCNRVWDLEFQYENLGHSFVNGKYRKHRAKILLENEKSKLPEAQQVVEHENNLKNMDVMCKRKRDEEDAACLLFLNKQRERYVLDAQKKEMLRTKRSRTTFLGRKCPKEGCDGFLSSMYKCPLCETRVCSTCLSVKDIEEEHKCVEADILSAELIKKETRGCPKCSTRIFKIEGCDQMFCTQCHTAFSWQTGNVAHGAIHNPHFFEWARQNNGGERVRNPGEVVCGGIPDFMLLHSVVEKYQCYDTVRHIFQGVAHIQDEIVNYLRRKVQRDDNEDLRVKFLKKEIDEKTLESLTIRRDMARQKALSMLHIVELYLTVAIEILNTIVEDVHSEDDILKAIDTITRARKFCNTQFGHVAANFKTKAYHIDHKFIIRHMISAKEFNTDETL